MAEITQHLTVTRDGMHNAFPSLIEWRGSYWVCYRKASWHQWTESSSITIAVSSDRIRFREVAHLSTAGDSRDPEFVISPDDRLGVLGCVTKFANDEKIIRPIISFTNDGYNWSKFTDTGPEDYNFFKIRKHDSLYYATGCYRERGGDIKRMELWTSENLLDWTMHCQVGPDEMKLNESDIVFLPGGKAVIIARTVRKPDHVLIAHADAPYKDWSITDLKMRIHAPCLLYNGEKVLLAARNNPKMEGITEWPFGNSMALWEVKEKSIEKILQFQASGDCAYPSLIQDSVGRYCMAYYSMHSYHQGVVPPFNTKVMNEPDSTIRPEITPCSDDIYYCELEL
ncbi:MAG: hypothetical protein ACYTFY_16530 [Planctomycetota bacterium]